MDKPVAAQMREWIESQDFYEICQSYRHARDPIGREGQPSASEAFETLKREIMAHITASIPDGAVPVVWPKELTRERLEHIASTFIDPMDSWTAIAYDALRALAAIAPVRKKRVVNFWRFKGHGEKFGMILDCPVNEERVFPWEIVARNVELED